MFVSNLRRLSSSGLDLAGISMKHACTTSSPAFRAAMEEERNYKTAARILYSMVYEPLPDQHSFIRRHPPLAKRTMIEYLRRAGYSVRIWIHRYFFLCYI